jgi:hypothetical protein
MADIIGTDLRAVMEEGIDHVMSVFIRHLTENGAAGALVA